MINEYNIEIENNSNNGDIIINFSEDVTFNSEYWISKGNVCLKNLNYEGAFECFYQATFYECDDQQLYYCYKKLMFLTNSFEEKYKFLYKLFKLKKIKKTKLDIFMYILIHIVMLLKTEPFILFFVAVILFNFFILY